MAEYEAPVGWLWHGVDETGKVIVTYGRWQRHPCQHRYKYAEVQATEHDHGPTFLDRAIRLMHHLSLERERGLFRRWYINAEPLRNDAANIMREMSRDPFFKVPAPPPGTRRVRDEDE